VVVDGQVIPLISTIASLSPREIALVHKVLAHFKMSRNDQGRPKSHLKRLIGDRVCVSDTYIVKEFAQSSSRAHLPTRKKLKQPKVQDGRKLRHYHKR
jgi:hypothetical protein